MGSVAFNAVFCSLLVSGPVLLTEQADCNLLVSGPVLLTEQADCNLLVSGPVLLTEQADCNLLSVVRCSLQSRLTATCCQWSGAPYREGSLQPPVSGPVLLTE